MDYQYENLDPGRFQELCQSLLLKDHSNVLCFPIGQRDGGRDAIGYYPSSKVNKEFIVFQIKQVKRQPDHPHKWLENIIKEEAPKVSQLIPKGAKAYYLLTNVRGTAHLDVGSIDKVNKILYDAIEIPSTCLWRDDLNRRLDNAWDLKWAYPEIITALDLLRYILENGLSEDRHRLISVIETFVQGQYIKDEVVRFKQGGLIQSKLLDLYIDVPIGPTDNQEGRRQSFIHYLIRHEGEIDDVGLYDNTLSTMDHYLLLKEGRHYLGAAIMLMHPFVQQEIPFIVLEGAPGQGKSTIVQFVCQMYRLRILKENMGAVAANHRPTSLRIPIKIDLRDFATWLDGQNPFSSEEHEGKPEGWYKSLEAFLAYQIRYDSGWAPFSVSDLHAVVKLSSLLLVLDGFDEVADISKRQEVVTEVTTCVKRLKTIAASLQVIVTSRPAAFANSPGFSEKLFPHFELRSLTIKQINAYASKWVNSQSLDSRDGAEVKSILKEKLNQPHLRDLATNPMQLAILLTLIHLRGPSLPDQRTALYDSYVERFFDREADKNVVVRENRNLLINIHGYLAWILHSETEQGRDRGSVNIERLKRLLMDYLLKEDLEVELAEKLSISTVDRICFLVSRVQGTFEFEVQPLREYFAARFLYKTAPHPSPGVKSCGTILDRFEAISMNFYWLNVTRFFAGFYNPGELPSLVYQLQDLAQKEGYCYISHPKVLAATLLSDSVFAQHKRAMKDVLILLFGNLGIRYFSSTPDEYSSTAVSLVLPKDCGQNELVKYCFAELHKNYAEDYVKLFCSLIKSNSTGQEAKELWYREALHVVGDERTRWFHYGVYLQVLPHINQNELEELLSDDPDNLERIRNLFRTGQLEKVSRYEQHCKILVASFFADVSLVPNRGRSKTVLDLFGQMMNVNRYAWALHNPEPIPLDELWKRRGVTFTELETPLNEQNLSFKDFNNLLKIIELLRIELKRSAKEWATELSSWDRIVEMFRSIWGEQWLNFHFANIASGIKSPKETCKDFPDLLDSSKSLCKRTRYARLRAGVPEWWKKQLDAAHTDQEKMFISLVLLTWGSSSTIIHFVEDINTVFNQMSIDNWQRIVRSLKQAVSISDLETERNRISFDVTRLPFDLSERTTTVLGIRAKSEDATVLYQKYLLNYQGTDNFVLQFCQETALKLALIDPNNWQQALKAIENSYAERVILEPVNIISIRKKESSISSYAAENIAQQPEKYPRVLVPLIEVMYREVVAQNIIPVGEIARNQHWFEE